MLGRAASSQPTPPHTSGAQKRILVGDNQSQHPPSAAIARPTPPPATIAGPKPAVAGAGNRRRRRRCYCCLAGLGWRAPPVRLGAVAQSRGHRLPQGQRGPQGRDCALRCPHRPPELHQGLALALKARGRPAPPPRGHRRRPGRPRAPPRPAQPQRHPTAPGPGRPECRWPAGLAARPTHTSGQQGGLDWPAGDGGYYYYEGGGGLLDMGL